MSHITDTGRARPITHPSRREPSSLNHEIVRRLTGLINLGVSLLNSLFVLRFLVELLEAAPTSPFAQFIRTVTEPFLSVFQGLTRSPAFEKIAFELHLLLAVTVYSLLGWAVIKLLRIIFAGK
jgi:uncharacterized protein YggT (Ycf19 family)